MEHREYKLHERDSLEIRMSKERLTNGKVEGL